VRFIERDLELGALVEEKVALADAVGRPVATCAEAARILGLPS